MHCVMRSTPRLIAAKDFQRPKTDGLIRKNRVLQATRNRESQWKDYP